MARVFIGVTLFAPIGVGAAPPVSSSVVKPRYSMVKDQGAWWFQDSKGAKFVSLGVCCVDPGTSFLDYDTKNPSYAAFKSYPDKGAWATDIAGRLQAWHFNTIGAWSDPALFATPLYETPILNLGASAGAPWKDMWSDAVVQSIAKTAHDQIGQFKDKHQIVGYFSDNEMGWWEGALFDWIWKSSARSGQRAHFLAVLEQRYKTWPSFSKDFVIKNAGRFNDLLTTGSLKLRPGGAGMKSVQSYVSVLADRYYQLCRDAVRCEDPGALYLGDRYISNFYPEVAAGGKDYMDVVSSNLNANWNDGSFTHYYLANLASITGKPLLISEYYQAAKENRSGNKNDSSGFPVSATQVDRASAVEVATRHLISQPSVVGAHWFQYYDEPEHGRGDGEDYDMGLVDTGNQPYESLTKVFSDLDLSAVHTTGAPVGMDASSGIPSAPEKPSDLVAWNRTRGYIAPTSDSGRADLYACYSDDAIYLAICWDEDRFSEAFYGNGVVPPQDYPVVHLKVGKAYVPLSVPPKGTISVGNGAQVVHEIRGVRNELVVKIPAASVSGPELKAGDRVDLDVGLATRARAYFGRWRGTFHLGT